VATKKTDQQTEIVITRVVGRVPLSATGSLNPIGEAFRLCGEELGELARPGGDFELTFEAWGTTFTASASSPEAEPETRY
jgi:hypothetical protein